MDALLVYTSRRMIAEGPEGSNRSEISTIRWICAFTLKGRKMQT